MEKIINDTRLMIQVCDMYYNHKLTQFEIAEKLQISRPTVSKILAAALENDIVTITVKGVGKVFDKKGSAYIKGLVDEAVRNGRRVAVVKGNYEISEAIRLPSNFTIILEDAHLRLADGSHTNIFVNENNETPESKTPQGANSNISIIGRGRAILDGGEMNDVNERVPSEQRVAPLYKNCLILFTNVNGFKVSGLKCINQRWWAMAYTYCRNGYIGNIDFCADDRHRDTDGNIRHGLFRNGTKLDILVRNADGCDIREGCQNLVIENITGFTEDDSVALTGLPGKFEERFRVNGLSPDIAFIKIRNIRTAAFCTNLRLLSQGGGVPLHDIDVDGVYDCSEDSSHMNKGNFAVRLGDNYQYNRRRHATEDEVYNISIKNVYGRGQAVLAFAGGMKNVTLYGIEGAEGTPMFHKWDPTKPGESYEATHKQQ